MHDHSFSRSGNIVDVANNRIFKGTVRVVNGKIHEIREGDTREDVFILPGLVDAHVHVESSMLIPSEFARLAVMHGTVATVSDPHEIANVLGLAGVEFMIRNGGKVPFKFYFGAPSCVPATPFESSGSVLGPDETETMLSVPGIKYLAEMMNFPGVLHQDPEILAKLSAAKRRGKPVDGHAPGLRGEAAKTYVLAGITTDHECSSLEEAVEKIRYGMNILIREGSAAKNFDALAPLFKSHPDRVMLCSDDKHPDDLLHGHINVLVKRAILAGYDPLAVIRSCTWNPAKHYGLETGLLRTGDAADIVVADRLETFNVLETYIDGELVSKEGVSLLQPVPEEIPNIFIEGSVCIPDLQVRASGNRIRVIGALDGELITRELLAEITPERGLVECDIGRDILKMAVINRYQHATPALGFVNGFGLKKGALASSVAHDSHNIIAVGTDDKSLAEVINQVISMKGGISVSDGSRIHNLPLPVAGIMTNQDAFQTAKDYERAGELARSLGTSLAAPFMTLSFMALLVIPELKLSDKGLFDGRTFSFVPLFVD
jgi:adenine deaminase